MEEYWWGRRRRRRRRARKLRTAAVGFGHCGLVITLNSTGITRPNSRLVGNNAADCYRGASVKRTITLSSYLPCPSPLVHPPSSLQFAGLFEDYRQYSGIPWRFATLLSRIHLHLLPSFHRSP
jgi:hypothetical protein